MISLKTSVIIPFYNASKTIIRSIESVLNQSTAADEILLINDGSTDDSLSKIELFLSKEKNINTIKIISLLKNSGVSKARNTGISNAQNPIHVFLDSDDSMHQDKIKTVHTFFKTYPNAIGFTHDYSLEKQSVLPTEIKFIPHPFLNNIFKNKGSGSSIVVYNKDKKWKFNESINYSEDFDLSNRLSYTNKFYYCKEKLAIKFRKTGSAGGLSGEKSKMRKGERQSFKNIKDYAPKYIWLIPILLLYSYLKQIFRSIL